MKHSQFLAFSTPNFIGSISVVEATVTIRSLFRKSFLFLAFMLLPMLAWGATYNLVGSTSLNTTDFCAGVTFTSGVSYQVDGTTYTKCATFGNTGTPVGVYNANKYIKYDTKTDETDVDVVAYNYNTSDKKLYIAVLQEGATTCQPETITVKKGSGVKKSYKLSGRSSIICTTADKKIVICQMTANEKGDANLHAGDIGYSINFNKPRFIVENGSQVFSFEEMEYCLTAAQKFFSTTEGRILAFDTHYLKFSTTTPVVMKVTLSSNYKFTVSNSSTIAGSVEYGGASGDYSVELTAGTWYIHPASSSETKITNIAFSVADPKYQATFVTEHGEAPASVETSKLTLQEIQATGYLHKGWKADKAVTVGGSAKSAGTLLENGTEVTLGEATTFTAQWSQAFTITYNHGANGSGSIDATQKAAGANATLALTMFESTRVGYVQVGWATSDGGDLAYNMAGTYSADEDVTLYPVWSTTKTYTAAFDNTQGYSALQTVGWTFTQDGEISASAKWADYKKVFDDASISGPSSDVSNDEICIAKNTSAYIKYDLSEGTSIKSLTIGYRIGTSNAKATNVKFLDKNGSEISAHANTLSISASNNWVEKSKTLTNLANVRYIVIYGCSNWVTVKSFAVEFAGKEADKYTVSFAKGDEGASGSMDPVEVAEGTEYTVPACGFTAPSNKEFDKWTSTDVTISGGKFTMPSSDVTLTATWKDAGKVTVTYDANGANSGSAPVDETQYTIGTSVTVLGNTGDLAKTGYAFACWNTQADGLGTDYMAGSTFDIAANTTLYAKWNEVGSSTWGYLGTGTAGTNTYTTKAMFPGVDATSTINDVELTSDPGWDTYYQTLATDLVNTTATKIQYICLHTNGLAANLNVINSKVLVSVSVAYTKLDANANLYLQFANGSGNIGDEIAVTGNTTSQLQKIETFAAPAGATKAKLYRKTGTADNWNTGITYIKAIAASEYDIATTTAEHGTFAVQLGGADVTKAPEGATVALVATPDAGYDIQAWDVYKTGEETTKVTVTDNQFTMPAYNVTVAATFQKVISTDATLKDLKVDGTTVTGFSPATYSYDIQLPYKTTTVPTVTATKNNQFASDPVITPAASLPGATTVKVTAEDGTTTLTYTINFTIAPKDGLCIVKTATTGSKVQVLSGLYADMEATNMVNISSDKKLGGSGNYIGVQMVSTQKFKEGDIINVHTTTAGGQGNIAIYSNKGTTATKIADLSSGFGVKGDNKFALPKSAESYSTLYICRTDANNWNGYVDFVEVTRPMNPVLTALTVAGAEATIHQDTKKIEVELPHGTEAATAALVPTIVANGGTPTAALDGTLAYNTPINYIITDKDGDQTTYELTATEAVLKHTVTFDTKGGTTIDSREIVDGQKLGDVTSPEKWDNTFAGWNKKGSTDIIAKIEDEVITADVTYEANWTPETGVIKLIDGGKINRPAFSTGATMQSGTVEYKGVEMPYAKLSGTASSISNVNDTNKLIIYNPTTTQTKIKVVAHSTSSSERKVYISYLLEGGTTAPTPVEYSLTSANPFLETDYIEFNSTEHRSIYIHVPSSVGDVQFLQIKVIESGEPLVKAGEDGYSLNMNKGRMPMPSGTSEGRYFDGVTFTNIGSGYAILNSPYITLKSGNCSFKVENDITLSVTTTGSSNKYYVTKDAPGTDNETTPTADVANTFDLTAGTWYISTAGSNVYLTNISFSKPNAPKPEITTQPQTNKQFDPSGNLTATVVVAAVSKGTLTYQWYDASDDSEVAGATAATLTTTTAGSYYVIITNTLENYNTSTTKSETAELAYRDQTIATLSTLSYGETAITLVAAQYEYEVELAKGTTVVPALTATTTSSYATRVINDAPAFVKYQATSTVTVTAEDGITQLTYTVHFTVKHDVELQDVTGAMTWNFTNKGAVDAQVTGENDGTYRVLANYDGVKSSFNGQYMSADLNKITTGNLQGKGIKIHTTVPGLITIEFSNTDTKTNYRVLYINGVATTAKSKTSDHVTYSQIMAAGDIVLTAFEETKTWNMLNFYKIEFTPATRLDRSDLTAGKVTGVCLENNVTHFLGAKFYYLSYKATDESSITLAEVDHLNAGYPYIMIAEGKDVYYMPGEETADEAKNYNGLYGTFENKELGDGYCILINNKYYRTHTGNNNGCYAHRAYLKLDEVSTDPVTTAPGESDPQVAPRFFVLGGEGRGTATDLDMIGETELGEPRKFIIHNQVVILRNGQFYNAQGALLK